MRKHSDLIFSHISTAFYGAQQTCISVASKSESSIISSGSYSYVETQHTGCQTVQCTIRQSTAFSTSVLYHLHNHDLSGAKQGPGDKAIHNNDLTSNITSLQK